jgi:hypothetical protein
VFNEGFEGNSNCDGFTGGGIAGDYGPSHTAHSGLASCYVCNDAGGAALITKTITVQQAGTLTASAWFSAEDGTTQSELDLSVAQGNTTQGTGAVSVNKYVQIATTGSVTVMAGQTVKISVGITSTQVPGYCLDIDDIVVTLK